MSKFLDKDGLEYFWTLIKAYIDTHGEEIHIGRTPPTDENIKIWIDTSGDGTPLTVTGISPLVFTNAVAENITSLIQYGKCAQSGTPTPEAPVDIMCNNGAVQMARRSGLPSGYKLLEYVGGSGSQYVITDLYLASTDVIECEFRNSATTGYGAVYGIFALGESSALYGNQTYYGYSVSNNKVDTDIQVDTEWHTSRHDFVNGTLTIDNATATFTPFEFENGTKNAVLSRYYNGSYGYNWKGYIRKFKVTRNGEVVCDLLPAKDSNDVAGLYDLVTGAFYTATGGTLLEGNTVDDYELRVVGAPEVLTVSQNLLTRDGETTGEIINANGTVSENASYCISAPFTLSAGNYVCTWNNGSAGTRPFSVFACEADGTPKTDGRIFYQARTETGINTGEFIVEAETLAVSSYRNNSTDLTIYRTPQAATVANLYAVGDYKDTQDIISGAVNRKVGIKVLDGTETWGQKNATDGQIIMRLNDAINQASAPIIVTHGRWSTSSVKDSDEWRLLTGPYLCCYSSLETTDDFKARLAAQYAAGTPYIVMYPLAEEQTEQVDPHPIIANDGDNVIIVSSAVGEVELKVEYLGVE